MRSLQLLGLPLAFTQNDLLSLDDFTKRAGERGVHIRPEHHLLELHRRRALVPPVSYRAAPAGTWLARFVPVAVSATDGYHQYRSPLALVIVAAQHGHLADPENAPFRRWDSGLPLLAHGGIQRYPSAFYSPYQLGAGRRLEGDLIT